MRRGPAKAGTPNVWSSALAGPEQFFFHQLTKQVADSEMALLDPGGICGRDDDRHRDTPFEGAAVSAGQTDGLQAFRGGFFHGEDDVRRVAAGGDADHDVIGATKSFDLPRKD